MGHTLWLLASRVLHNIHGKSLPTVPTVCGAQGGVSGLAWHLHQQLGSVYAWVNRLCHVSVQNEAMSAATKLHQGMDALMKENEALTLKAALATTFKVTQAECWLGCRKGTNIFHLLFCWDSASRHL
jgi:hypothetical protein